jgi:hypothetical protein
VTTKEAWTLRKQRYGPSGCRDPSTLAYWRGKHQSKETKEKKSLSSRAWYSDPENHERFLKAHHQANLGKAVSAKTRRRISENQKGVRCPQRGRLGHAYTGGRPIKGTVPWMKGKHHTLESRIKVSESKKKSLETPRGLNHPMWRGGLINRGNFRVNGLLHRLWREQVFERDSFTCQKCEENDPTRLVAHHIVPFRVSHDNSLENGITLCRSCHASIEAKLGDLK